MAAKTASLSVNIIADAAKAKAGLKEAETAFGKFRREVGDSQGAMGKFQSVAGGAFDYVKANAMSFATAAGAAVTAFVVKSVSDFQSLVLSIGKFSDATGIGMENASRLVEVAGDIGIEMGTLQKSIGFMNKTLGNNADAFKELGVQIAYTSGGAVDANQTFINVVDRLNKIQDPAARAAAGAKLLGKGWQEMAELIGMGSAELTRSLNEVESTKVFNADQLARAKELRDSFDELKGRVEGFANALGDRLVPVLTDAVNVANTLFDVFKTEMPLIGGTIGSRFADAIEWTLFRPIKLGSMAVDFLSDAFGKNKDEINTYIPVTAEMARVWGEGYRAMINGRIAADDLAAAIRRQGEDVDVARGKWDTFRGALNFQAEYLRLEENIGNFRTKWATTTDEAKRKSKEYQQELINIQIQLANSALAIAGLATAAQNNRIRLLIETGQLERALSLINAIKAGMNQLAGAVTPDRVERLVSPQQSGVYVDGVYIPPGLDFSGFMAEGGIVKKQSLAVVGEAGPEVVIPLNDPRRAAELMQQTGLNAFNGVGQMPLSTSRSSSGDTYITVQVDAGLVSSPDQVGQQIIDAIRRAERRSGQVFASV